MREPVGHCYYCDREIYCHDGFLNGYTDQEGRLSCFEGEHWDNSDTSEKCNNIDSGKQ